MARTMKRYDLPACTPNDDAVFTVKLCTVGWSVPSKTRRGLPPAHSSIHSSKPMTVAPPLMRG